MPPQTGEQTVVPYQGLTAGPYSKVKCIYKSLPSSSMSLPDDQSCLLHFYAALHIHFLKL